MCEEILLSSQEIKDRLHYFNLTQDWCVFTGVPEKQQVCFMYPSFMRALGHTDAQYKECLIRQFGPLSPEWQVRYNIWLETSH